MMVITAKIMLIIVARPCGARNGGEKFTMVIPSPIGKPRSKWQKAKLYQTTQARLVLGPILVSNYLNFMVVLMGNTLETDKPVNQGIHHVWTNPYLKATL